MQAGSLTLRTSQSSGRDTHKESCAALQLVWTAVIEMFTRVLGAQTKEYQTQINPGRGDCFIEPGRTGTDFTR